MQSHDDNMQTERSLEDLSLTERWGAEDDDVRLFRSLGKEFSGKKGDSYFQWPGSFRGSELHKAILQRASGSAVAKTLLAVVMELNNVDCVSTSASLGMGALSEGNHVLDMIQGIVVPILAEDLSVYAGWKGFQVPSEFDLECDFHKKCKKTCQFTADWIFERLADDPDMQHYVEAIVHNELLNASFGLEEGVI